MVEEFLYAIKSKLGLGPKSQKWKHWVAQLDLKTCVECRTMHGKIYCIGETVPNMPPLHWYCRCEIKPMSTVNSGECSKAGRNGADWWFMHRGSLPEYYIYIDDLRALGWKKSKAPAKYAPGKMVFGGIFENKEGHLPDAAGRIWYEADLNYYSGKRNNHRLVWSNDGLFFVSYDHYESFIEVTGG